MVHILINNQSFDRLKRIYFQLYVISNAYVHRMIGFWMYKEEVFSSSFLFYDLCPQSIIIRDRWLTRQSGWNERITLECAITLNASLIRRSKDRKPTKVQKDRLARATSRPVSSACLTVDCPWLLGVPVCHSYHVDPKLKRLKLKREHCRLEKETPWAAFFAEYASSRSSDIA